MGFDLTESKYSRVEVRLYGVNNENKLVGDLNSY